MPLTDRSETLGFGKVDERSLSQIKGKEPGKDAENNLISGKTDDKCDFKSYAPLPLRYG